MHERLDEDSSADHPSCPSYRHIAERGGARFRQDGSGTGLFGNPRIIQSQSGQRAKDVLVYLIDTLRADRLGAGGGPAPGVSPTMDRLAREGAWLDLVLSSSPWTKPAIATLMSGILPTTHRVGAGTYTDRMPGTVALVQERFRAAGWRTGSFSASPLGSTLSALERGFDAAYPPRHWMASGNLKITFGHLRASSPSMVSYSALCRLETYRRCSSKMRASVVS